MTKNIRVRKNKLSVTSVPGVFFIACASLLLSPIVASSANALSPTDGRSEVINIGVGETIQRSFTATQDNLIVYGISNTSGGVLNYTIYDSRGSQVDNCVTGYHCSLYGRSAIQSSFNPPTTDTYFIAINFREGSPSGLVKTSVYSVAGSLKLSLSGGIQNPVPTLSSTTTASFLSTDAAKVFQFTATQGQPMFYGISNTSDGVLNYTIYDSTGKQVDKCVPGFHCAVYQHLASERSFNPPATGTYFIALILDGGAGSFNGIFAGNVKLSLSGGIQNPVPTLSGTTTASFLSTDAAKVFQFTATQGQPMFYGISNTSNGVLDYSIYDSTGKQVDSCGAGFPCSVYQHLASERSFNPPATGTYFIALILAGGAGSFKGVFAGNVKLSKTSSPKPVLKKKTITCLKGKLIKKVTAVKPVCPKGYKKK